MKRETILELRHYVITRHLSEGELKILAEHLEERTYAPGSELFVEGEFTDGLLFIHKGRIEVQKPQAGVAPLVVVEMSAPTVLGELELLDDAPASATVVAKTEVQAHLLSQDSYEDLLDKHSIIVARITRNIVTVLAQRLDATNQRLAQLVKPESERDAEEITHRIKVQWEFDPH